MATLSAADGSEGWSQQFGTVGHDFNHAVAYSHDSRVLVAEMAVASLSPKGSAGLADAFVVELLADARRAAYALSQRRHQSWQRERAGIFFPEPTRARAEKRTRAQAALVASLSHRTWSDGTLKSSSIGHARADHEKFMTDKQHCSYSMMAPTYWQLATVGRPTAQ